MSSSVISFLKLVLFYSILLIGLMTRFIFDRLDTSNQKTNFVYQQF